MWRREPALRPRNREGEDGAQMRCFKEGDSAELRNSWLWKQSKWEMSETTHGFLTRAAGWLGLPFCKKGSPEGTIPGGGSGDAELDCGKFMEFGVLVGHSGGGPR